MPGLFDRLDKEIKDRQKEGGISPLDLAGLPPALRRIMRVMLRELSARVIRACAKRSIPCRRTASRAPNWIQPSQT